MKRFREIFMTALLTVVFTISLPVAGELAYSFARNKAKHTNKKQRVQKGSKVSYASSSVLEGKAGDIMRSGITSVIFRGLTGLVWGDVILENDQPIGDLDGLTFTVNQLADSIFVAEGGFRAKKPYGILSVPCEGEKECRKICINTIRNNIERYIEWGHKKFPTYLDFLRSRYAPENVKNDPNNLNDNWLKNVRNGLK